MEKSKVKNQSRMMEITVKSVVLNSQEEVLILKRSKSDPTNPGKYDLPGGRLESGESFKETVLREIKEETGLEADLGEVIDVVEFPKKNPLFKEEIRGIRCLCCSRSSQVHLSSEHEGYEWLAWEKAAEKFSDKDGFEREKKETVLKAGKLMELKKSLEGWKRTLADFENYKKRQAGNQKEMLAYMNEGLILSLLPVLDNFQISVEHIPGDQKNSPWVVGIMHIQKQLEKVLSDNGTEEVKIKEGDNFDLETMEAVKKDLKDGEPETSVKVKVKNILQKGYKMGSKIIRAAKVAVE